MVTNYPHSVASHEDVSTRGEAHGEGIGERIMDRLRHMMCGLHGHDTLLQFEQGRMFLRCVSCGHETPGWEVIEPQASVTMRDGARHHAVGRQQLIGERRIA